MAHSVRDSVLFQKKSDHRSDDGLARCSWAKSKKNAGRILTKEKNVDICILDMPLLDTRRDKDLLGTLIADIVLQLLSYVAETERKLIRERQAEGIAAAKASGKTWGRQRRQLDDAFLDALKAWKNGEITCAKAAQLCGMTLSNFRYHARKLP